MTGVLVQLPARERLQAVLLVRTGLGWAVGVGSIVAGRIERDGSAYLTERDAERAALSLADRFDLIAVRSEVVRHADAS